MKPNKDILPPIEEWRPVVGYEKYYEVSNLGRVRSLTSRVGCVHGATRLRLGRILRPFKSKSPDSYYTVYLRGGKKDTVHRLVAKAFIPNPLDKPYVNHKNLEKLDNRVENLEWVTGRENCLHAVANGHAPNAKGVVLCADDIRSIRSDKNKLLRHVDLAAMFNVAPSTIRKIRRFKMWKHV